VAREPVYLAISVGLVSYALLAAPA